MIEKWSSLYLHHYAVSEVNLAFEKYHILITLIKDAIKSSYLRQKWLNRDELLVVKSGFFADESV